MSKLDRTTSDHKRINIIFNIKWRKVYQAKNNNNKYDITTLEDPIISEQFTINVIEEIHIKRAIMDKDSINNNAKNNWKILMQSINAQMKALKPKERKQQTISSMETQKLWQKQKRSKE